MGAIIWLASYPKSGNTWTRAFLHNLLRNPDEPADINSLKNFTMSEEKAQYYNSIDPRPCSEMMPEEIAELRPKVHHLLTQAFPDSVFVKTHNFLGELNGVSLVTMEETVGAIYVVRNPLDVVISFADHYGMTIDEAIKRMAESFMGTPTTDVGVQQVFNTWSTHVASWTANPSPGLHVMRYEDMLATPLKTFGQLAMFLGLRPPRKRLEKAVENASFKILREQEQKHGFEERSKHTRFFRSGTSDQWREVLSTDQVATIVSDHHEQMERFGYVPEGY